MKLKFLSTLFALVCVCTLGFNVSAQDNSTTNPNQTQNEQRPDFPRGERGGFGRGGKRGGPGGDGKMLKHSLSKLNLTEGQKQQTTAIFDKYEAQSKASREEMRGLMEQRRNGATLTPEQETRARDLRMQSFDTNKKMMDEIKAVLTPEQLAQLDKQREEMRDKMRERRDENRGTKPENNAPTTTTTPQN